MTIEYDQLEANAANFVPLTPLSFLHRTADIYPQRESLVYNQTVACASLPAWRHAASEKTIRFRCSHSIRRKCSRAIFRSRWLARC
jgi:hypothetical protein